MIDALGRGASDQLLELLAAVIPEFLGALDRNGLSGIEFAGLLFLRCLGQSTSNGSYMALQKEFREGLLAKEFYYSPGDADVFFRRMEFKGFLRRQRITPAEKAVFFGTERGRMSVIVLQPAGVQKIEDVKRDVLRHYSDLSTLIPPEHKERFVALTSTIQQVIPLMLARVQKG